MNLGQRFADPLSQAVLRLWVDLYKDSLLKDCIIPVAASAQSIIPIPPLQPQPTPTPLPQPQPTPRPRKRIARSPDRQRTPRPPREPRPTPVIKTDRKTARADQRVEQEVKRLSNVPLSDWAKRLLGDERISDVTFEDILEGIDDYFAIFKQMRLVNRDAYDFFSRVGAPIITRHIAAWSSHIRALSIPNGAALPTIFGAFVARSKEEAREQAIDDKPYYQELMFFEKIKNAATAAPLDTTVFRQNYVSLSHRDFFSREELKKFPWARENWGYWYWIGVLPDGEVRALPCKMQHHQRLPRGDYVHTSQFVIPPGLYEMNKGRKKPSDTVHDFVRLEFAAAMAFTASALTGLQVTIKKGKVTARIGIPITSARAFFADRDRPEDGSRRKPILHLMMPHDRHMRDGRIIPVGEHLRGIRTFTWRGYDITVGAPGLHYPAIESFDIDVYDSEEGVPEGAVVFSKYVGNKLAELVQRSGYGLRFRRGKPNQTYKDDTLQKPIVDD